VCTLTMKVGETMETKENRRKNEGERAGKRIRTGNLLGFGKHLRKSLARSFCYMALKMRLREIGHSIRCEGKLKISGTKNIKIGDHCHFARLLSDPVLILPLKIIPTSVIMCLSLIFYLMMRKKPEKKKENLCISVKMSGLVMGQKFMPV
jgi:hypothetical protein